MKTKTSLTRNSMSRSPLRYGLFFTAIALACCALCPQARATCQEGCLTNNNTVLGDDALLNNTGSFNTAIGANALMSNTSGSLNTALGQQALVSNTTGTENVAIGDSSMFKNTQGLRNTAAGHNALSNYTSGSFNTAFGYQALLGGDNGIGTGSNNTAVGYWALIGNQSGSNNTATGYQALFGSPDEVSNCSNNTADGANALYSNTSGSNNVASGSSALYSNSIGSYNTATGQNALYANTTGVNNTATGAQALSTNTTGLNNAADGYQALFNNTTGNYNTAAGQGSLYSNTTGRNNTAAGQNAMRNNTTGSFNVALGDNAGFNLTTGSNNIEIGNRGVAGEANTIRLGVSGTQTNTYIAGIFGAALASGSTVRIDSAGHLGTVASSARFKQEIKPMDNASEAILALEPVTFRYKHELDPAGIPQFGLVAEEVEKVNPDLVERDQQGKPYSVRYDAVNAMLLNEFLKEQRKVQELEANAARQQKQIDALTAGLRKVSAQLATGRVRPIGGLELNKTAAQTVLNSQ